MKAMNLRLDDETRALLQQQAQAAMRSATAQIAWLIHRESEKTQASTETK